MDWYEYIILSSSLSVSSFKLILLTPSLLKSEFSFRLPFDSSSFPGQSFPCSKCPVAINTNFRFLASLLISSPIHWTTSPILRRVLRPGWHTRPGCTTVDCAYRATSACPSTRPQSSHSVDPACWQRSESQHHAVRPPTTCSAVPSAPRPLAPCRLSRRQR